VNLVEALIFLDLRERQHWRQEKDWERADRIRKFFELYGVVLEDRPDGSTRYTGDGLYGEVPPPLQGVDRP
jgi:cysteinyl-tRNA synthetase